MSTGLDIFVITCINIATAWTLWPSNAADAFRVYDGSVAAAMLGGEDAGDGADFHSALDEAYAYTAMGGAKAVSGGAAREYEGAL